MILKQNTIYQVDSAILADPTRIRASWAPTLSVSSGKIRLKVRVEGAIPTGSHQMETDSERESGIYPIEGEFTYILWEALEGTPQVRISPSIKLKEID